MRTLTLGVVVLLAATAPGLAGAQSSSKLAIGTIRGDASQVRRQILLQICGPYACVAASRYTTDDRPDPEKLAAGGVAGYLGGAVTGERGQKRVVLTLTTPSSTAAKPARTWRLKLGPDGKLTDRALDTFSIELDEILQGEASKRPPAPAAPPQRAQPTPPPPPAKAPPPAPKAPPPAPKAPPPSAKAPPPAAKPPPPRQAEPERAREPREPRAPRAANAPLRAAAEAGLWVTSRKLGYSGASGGTLRTYDAKFILVPSARLEIYPASIADAGDRLVQGIGLRLDYGHSIGLTVKPPAGSTEGTHAGALSAMRVGVLWRVQPLAGSTFTLAPALGYRSLQVVTSAKDGVTIEGLPDAKLSGLEARVDLEAPVAGMKILGGAGYTMWTSAKDLVKGGFFGSGSARAFEIEGGVDYKLMSPLSLRVVLVYESTSYSGLGDPAGGIGTASGATEKYFGGRATVRAEW